jgi:hypothetical protein
MFKWWLILLLALPLAAQPIDYGPMQVAGTIDDPRINESSGVAASALFPGEFWTHNDSGGHARLYRFDATGQVTATVGLDLPRPRDWEDLAALTWNGKPWLLVGDVGDNAARRESVTLWLLPEPDAEGNALRDPLPAVRIDVRYADGPRDCEGVAYDAEREEVVLLSKVDPRRDFTDQSAAYVFNLRDALARIQAANGAELPPLKVERAATLPLKIVTAADISPDGRRCVALTYGDAWVFERAEDQTWADAFAKPPQQIALGPRGQSEAVAYQSDGESLVLTTEGVGKDFWVVGVVSSE